MWQTSWTASASAKQWQHLYHTWTREEMYKPQSRIDSVHNFAPFVPNRHESRCFRMESLMAVFAWRSGSNDKVHSKQNFNSLRGGTTIPITEKCVLPKVHTRSTHYNENVEWAEVKRMLVSFMTIISLKLRRWKLHHLDYQSSHPLPSTSTATCSIVISVQKDVYDGDSPQ